MRSSIVTFLCCIALLMAGAQSAEAGIPIPCTGESIITVAKTPPDFMVPTKNGGRQHLNLGYKFSGCTGGEWVAYSGTGSTYYHLNDIQLKLLTFAAGLKELPPPPSYLMTFSASWSAWLWIALVGFALLAKLMGSGNSSSHHKQTAGPRDTTGKAFTDDDRSNMRGARPARTVGMARSRISAPGQPTFSKRG
ncbi:MAG: hypothetical protein ACK5JT_19850 [Hyphomicrobiaceae bacterium]